MGHKSISIREIDLREYLENSVDINILVSAFYSYETHKGRYKYVLLYKNHT